ncbi:SubName: Full=Related to carboxyl methyl transferase {ECO:0000313/EMBL:CCA77941.1} [Serendipita indica DSM 11827]|nr:SubName: Full=Related to carboxyl methyl transferase {ECO:0000313/EMBL:CCA77941.1} [Serendipita indica DSM 11827]
MSTRIARSVSTGLVLAGAALTAGGIFCFPLYAPTLVERLSLSQAQVSTIALAGMSAQYPLAAVMGSLLDTYGTWLTSLIAGILFSSGFGSFAYQLSKAGRLPPGSANSPFRILVACFFLCGVGTAASLFTIMFSASQAFPGHTGISTGASTAFFGLSPLFLSDIASSFFSNEAKELNVTKFIIVLSITAGIAHVVAAAFLRIFPPKATIPHTADEEIDNPVPVIHPTEHTPLLSGPNKPTDEVVAPEQTIRQLLKDVDFWLLALTMLLLLGSCEMVLSNIGTIVLGVPMHRGDVTTGVDTPSGSEGGVVQVRLLSLSNTCARLLVGPLADYLAPAPLAHPTGEVYFPRKRYVSRLAFLSTACALMAIAYLWMAAGVVSQTDIYLVSIATGVAYGSAFTVTPSIVASLWLGPNAGRNFGIVTYAPFIGTPLFAYLYAFISQSYQLEGETVCTGTRCWRTTFFITTATTTVALLLSLTLLRRRRESV